MSFGRTNSEPKMMVLEINSVEDLMMLMMLLEAMSKKPEVKAEATATRAPSSPMMFRSPSPSSPVVSHDCGADKVVEAPKPRGCH